MVVIYRFAAYVNSSINQNLKTLKTVFLYIFIVFVKQ